MIYFSLKEYNCFKFVNILKKIGAFNLITKFQIYSIEKLIVLKDILIKLEVLIYQNSSNISFKKGKFRFAWKKGI